MEQIIKKIFEQKNLICLIMSNPRKKSLPYKKVTLRPIMLHEHLSYQAEYHFEKNVTQENFSSKEAQSLIVDYIQLDFKQLDIFTTIEDIQILASKPEKPRVIRKPASKCVSDLSHNREKQYIIPDGQPCDFLIRLSVMDKTGKVYQKHYKKFRQINRYLEILQDVEKYLPENKIKIIDFGCGKAYLTFAVYYYLKIIKNKDVEIIGLDLKQNVIEFCNEIAKDLHYNNLKFQLGDIAEYQDTIVDMVITLHACDTATDFALINAVKWNTNVILSVPCCQHELFEQISESNLNPILKHGIIKDRFTEILTDGLRGLKLESAGYETSMIEFTSLEHTAKNIMIKAIKTGNSSSSKSKRAANEYAVLCDQYNVHPTIDELK